jgi:hypothetical protein
LSRNRAGGATGDAECSTAPYRLTAIRDFHAAPHFRRGTDARNAGICFSLFVIPAAPFRPGILIYSC